ncbi:class I SAM-dependent methyltransferase [Nonlabens sp. Ci31]|jgi:hypothetical protein|uniref:class I SAM-dependent methyltransferase n=1 Tax=Nonlabens sp. Ci31 TaxID=2608253 RepID=UPI001462C9F4|nr:methyltransferase domain-containing protein [Nonlabens sp. Ci31]QJP34721.1 class I SAM-dependent methyltransferase [Nonlabens sp. Ci31]
MKQYPAQFWNERYEKEEYIYGTSPNQFFKEQLDTLPSGSILLPAEGEGRNALYAAKNGWDVTAFDISSIGKEKAIKLAVSQNVTIDYQIENVLNFESDKRFDTIGLSYAHFPANIRKKAHLHLLKFLKPKGVVIFEAFAKAQLGNPSGGPQSEEMLFSIEEVKIEFPDFDFKILKQESITLSEGNYHKGNAEVIRFVGMKKK